MSTKRRHIPFAVAAALLTLGSGCGHPVLDVTYGMLPMMVGRVEIAATLMPLSAAQSSGTSTGVRMSKVVFFKIAGNQYSTTDPGPTGTPPPLVDMAVAAPTDMAAVADLGGTDLGAPADMATLNTSMWRDTAEFILDMPAGLTGMMVLQADMWLDKNDTSAPVIGDCTTLKISGNDTYEVPLTARYPRLTCGPMM